MTTHSASRSPRSHTRAATRRARSRWRRGCQYRQEGREGGAMPSADLRDGSSTGEPCAPKGACTIRGGAVGKGLEQAGTSLAAYSTSSIRRGSPAVQMQECQDLTADGPNG